MKKLLSAFLAAVIALTLAACASEKQKQRCARQYAKRDANFHFSPR